MDSERPGSAVQYVVYGKIIIDDIVLRDGSLLPSVLGGGGPQAAFGARLWTDSVGLLTRSGDDMPPDLRSALRGLDVDLEGWTRFPDLHTPRHLMQYDEQEYTAGGPMRDLDNWNRLLSRPLTLPPAYTRPRAIHLVTERPKEPMVQTALELRSRGAILSLEPLISDAISSIRGDMRPLLASVDLVTPDWPSASRIAGSDDPLEVVCRWSRLGAGAVAVRHGRHGSYVWQRGRDEVWHVPPAPVEVVDPTGAGNAYGGALCVGWSETGDIRAAACRATVAAAFLVRRHGLPAMSAALRKEARELLPRVAAATCPLERRGGTGQP